MIYHFDKVYPEHEDTLYCWESKQEINEDIDSLIGVDCLMED